MWNKIQNSKIYLSISFLSVFYSVMEIIVKAWKALNIKSGINMDILRSIDYARINASLLMTGVIMLILHYYPKLRNGFAINVSGKFRRKKDLVGLKERCSNLSQLILNFALKQEERLPLTHRASNSLQLEIESLFSRKFSANLDKVYNDLKSLGKNDMRLDALYNCHDSVEDIKALAKRLLEMSNRIE